MNPRTTLRRITAPLIIVVGQAVVFFVARGDADHLRGWLVFGLMALHGLIGLPLVRRYNPGLLAERWKERSDTAPYERAVGAALFLLLVSLQVTAGLDLRLGWSDPADWLIIPGLALMVAGMTLITATMLVNPHLEAGARIQDDRGHRVVSSGPYALVRHPMYLGGLLLYLGVPLVLGSFWAMIPAALIGGLFVVRTCLEDHLLHEGLAGYAEYAWKTRRRLIPGVW